MMHNIDSLTIELASTDSNNVICNYLNPCMK